MILTAKFNTYEFEYLFAEYYTKTVCSYDAGLRDGRAIQLWVIRVLSNDTGHRVSTIPSQNTGVPCTPSQSSEVSPSSPFILYTYTLKANKQNAGKKENTFILEKKKTHQIDPNLQYMQFNDPSSVQALGVTGTPNPTFQWDQQVVVAGNQTCDPYPSFLTDCKKERVSQFVCFFVCMLFDLFVKCEPI